MDTQTQRRAAVRRALGAEPHAGRPGRRSLRRAPLPRRAARGQGLVAAAALPQASSIPARATLWKPCYRLIPSRYPTVGLYDRIADPADLDVVFAIEALTNPRNRDEIGQLQLVPPDERVSGPGAT